MESVGPRVSGRVRLVGMSVMLLLSGVRCSGSDEDVDTGASRSECSSANWRAPTANQVVCPGPSGCQCAGGEVCCIPPSPAPGATGACTAMTACADVAFACDGPEDCAAGEVCCAKGYAAQCVAEADCFGVDAYVLCHADADCESKLGTTCGPADPNTFWDELLGVCR
jgi:hypothetical protein